MSGRLSDSAFEFYVGLGPPRSYQAVAQKYGVTKRAVVKHASRDKWSERLEKIEEEARAESDKRLATDMAEMHERHKRMLRAVASRAIAAIKEHPLSSGMEGVRAAELVIKMERLLAGESSERSTVSVEEVTRRELDRWLVPAGAADDEPDGD
ncbi:MAG: hypothetical protein HOP15_06770 [Planctomycetes bacterium]|nr:hypothetical protein [Planctomycetota bacterium]